MEQVLIAYCGVDCSVCPDYTSEKCPGCRRTDWKPGDICLPVECCRRKGLSFCGECDTFSCSDMTEFYHESEGHEAAYVRMLSIRKENK